MTLNRSSRKLRLLSNLTVRSGNRCCAVGVANARTAVAAQCFARISKFATIAQSAAKNFIIIAQMTVPPT